MSEEKKELKKKLKSEELCEGKKKLSMEDLEKVTGGTTKTPEFKAGKGLKEATK